MSTNEKSLPVEMTYTENQLLKAAVVAAQSLRAGDQQGALFGVIAFDEMAKEIGEVRGQAFFERLSAHAEATKPTDDGDSTTAETAPTTTSPDPVTDEKPVFLNEREATLIGAALSFISSFFYNDTDEAANAVEVYNFTAQSLGLDGQEMLEKKFTAAFDTFAPKEV